jgi:uncharacterized tellurite resistance protein B-like protein
VLIWGTKPVRTTIDRGEFFCPQCRSRQSYERLQVQKHGHLYWIPLVRMGDPVEYVECGRCEGQFVPQVLESAPMDEAEFRRLFVTAVVTTMIAIAGADGEVQETEIARIQEASSALAGVDVDRHDVLRWASDAHGALATAEETLRLVAPMLSTSGKEMLMRSALGMAVADGEVSPDETAAIARLAQVIDVSPAHLSGLVGEAGV